MARERGNVTLMIRSCRDADFDAILEIINDAASAYRDVIPAEQWHEPYMSAAELHGEIIARVRFWGYEQAGRLIGVMGIQDVDDVTLIRHAYVRTDHRNHGIGARLLAHLRAATVRPMLIGTWADAGWAIRFYERRGFQVVSDAERDRLLQRYWTVPPGQIDASVVLADQRWLDTANSHGPCAD
jgi:GNAT superfamily N-acetyltransferase